MYNQKLTRKHNTYCHFAALSCIHRLNMGTDTRLYHRLKKWITDAKLSFFPSQTTKQVLTVHVQIKAVATTADDNDDENATSHHDF